MDQDPVQAELEARRKPGAVLERIGGLSAFASSLIGRGLPNEVRDLVQQVFSAAGYSRSATARQAHGKLGGLLKEYTESDWARVIRALLPHIAPSAESACRILGRRPYQAGLARKPFRCPRSLVMQSELRGRWLIETTILLGEYDADIRWVAERAAHLAGWSGAADIGWLLAGAIDAGGPDGAGVLDILKASASGEHPVAQIGRHSVQALLSCGRPDAWELTGRLLLAAQRQEGLRQAILESVDEAHPDAFRHILRLVKEENLSRFSSVVRAADTWFGFMWDGASGVKVDAILDRVLLFLDDPRARAAALGESDAETVYLALWSSAFEDIEDGVAAAQPLLSSSSADVRFVATHFLVQATWSSAVPPLLEMLADTDLRVAARALDAFGVDVTKRADGAELFQRLEQLLARVPKRSMTLDALVWPWWKQKLERPAVAGALAANAAGVDGARMLPYVPDLQPNQREAFVRHLAGLPDRWARPGHDQRTPHTLAEHERTLILELLGDPSADVRAAAFAAMREQPLLEDEVARLVDLLDRKPGDLRNGAIARLRTLPDGDFFRAVDRLLDNESDSRRLAGLELLRDAHEAKRAPGEVRQRTERYGAAHVEPSEEERVHLAAMSGAPSARVTTDDALGLIDRAALREWPEPRQREVSLDTAGSRASLDALAALVDSHAQTEIRTARGDVKLLIESVPWNFGPRKRAESETAPDVPLSEVWQGWARSRPHALRDEDGLELLRALCAAGDDGPPWKSAAIQKVVGLGKFGVGARFLTGLLEWCLAWDPPQGVVPLLVDGLESAIATLTAADYRALSEHARNRHAHGIVVFGTNQPAHKLKVDRARRWLNRIRWWGSLFPSSVDLKHAERIYGLLRAFEAASCGYPELRVTLQEFLAVYETGIVGENEFIDLLVGRWAVQPHDSLLRAVTSRKRQPKELLAHPELLAVVDRCRGRIVEVESQRGDRTTAASALALELRVTGGLDTVSRALPALGKSHFARSFSWSLSAASRQETLSHLVLRSIPRDEDTPEAFERWARAARLKESRLVELAVYAPQWAAHVNHVLGWPQLESAVWWIEAHTKDDRSWQLDEFKQLWAAGVSERTPLSATELTEGAVDVAWFRQVFEALGPERWKSLDAAAKYAASAGGHTRAQLFARAMAGLVTEEELLKRIDASRHQDSVRALGLLPLSPGDAGRKELLTRYTRLQAFRRESRTFGSQRQASEGRAVAIALANLARTAGYTDPQRLQWAMERDAVADLASGPVVLEREGVRLTLSIDADGVPALSTTKNGKALKAIPAALKKDPDIAELKHRLTELKRQRSRVREALEEAMCRGDHFTASELRTLVEHPILAPALSRLVFVGDGVGGYPDEGGRVLRDHGGRQHPLGNDEQVYIAHPHDLFARGDWSAWQHECFRAERVQPFKQIFRELYPMTDAERGTDRTRRYAGHQVHPRQALALLGGRGWVARPEEGVSRTFHAEGLTVWIGFEETFYTPADIEGLTLDEVAFTRKGETKLLPLAEIPARVFSEAMRDLDLVVSVAHQGGVDPEATASTVEMRAALVKETCTLLGLGNVEMQPTHAIVRGELATYAVHLGSAGASVMPGTSLPIVAVHSQHRGRLFLPFADDDPRTAEVLSKVLLLARDREIRDPNILQWIRAAKHGVTV